MAKKNSTPRVEVSKEEKETDIFDEIIDNLDEGMPDEPEESEKELIKEQGIKEEDTKPEKEPEKEQKREEIKETIMQKAKLLSSKDTGQKTDVLLKFLEDEKEPNVFIGRKKGVFKKYGFEAGFLVGKVNEEEQKDKNVYLDGLNPHVVFVCGARGSGKCVTGDTLIALENGLTVPIRELENFDGKILGLNHSLKIESLHREGFFRRTVDRVLKIRLRSGKEIKLTHEHPLLTIDGWKQAKELEPKSRIATPRVLPAFGALNARECEVKLLAYLIAEGHLSNHFVLFSNTDIDIQKDFFESVYGFDPSLKIREHSKPNCFRVSAIKKEIDISNIARNKHGQFTSDGFIVAQKNRLVKWIESKGLYGKLSKQKFIPQEFLQIRKEQMALFLNRLFSCDGSIYRINKGKNWCIDYSSSSEKLIGQVQHLLLRFGILSTLRTKTVKTNGKNFKVFELIIYGENVIRFISEIGFFGAKKEKQEKAFMEMTGLNRNPNTDTIPKEIWKDFKPSNWTNVGRKIGYSSPKSLHSSVNYAPSRDKLLKLAVIEENKGIQILAESDIFWDEIIEKTEINEQTEVFDISVPVYHNFVANDIIVHNSYYLGVMAEELATKNRNVGTVLIDPVGVFWSMRFPNKEDREIERLEEYGLKPHGLDNIKVFIPKGMIPHVPESTFDAGFAIQPSLLTGEDWCLTFGIDRFSVTGLLLEKTLKKVETGFKVIESGKKVPAKEKDYTMDDLVFCLEKDDEINSREKGYKPDSIRALVSRFEAAKTWGIFDDKGTPLSQLSRQNQLTIIDTSFLDATVTALVVGILSRRLLAARKLSTRKEAAQKFKALSVDQLLELEVPPTWLIVDEAHTLIPSGNEKTPASKALTEYVKQGRRPGCSLVFATQQPSAIDTKVLSQLDIILVHKLVFDDDIKAVYKRTPTIIPGKYKRENFVKTLPVGVALTGDRQEETSRAFVMRIRPRFSQHEGRDMESTGFEKSLSKKQVFSLAGDLIEKDVNRKGFMEKDQVKQVIETMNAKYSSDIKPEDMFLELEKKGLLVDEDKVQAKKTKQEKNKQETIKEQEEEPGLLGDEIKEIEERIEALDKTPAKEIGQQKGEPEEPQEVGLVSLPARVREKTARLLLDKQRKKKTLGLFGEEEQFAFLSLKNHVLWQVEYDIITRAGKEFISRKCFVDSTTGEFIHFSGGSFVHSSGLRHFFELNDEAISLLKVLQKKRLSMEELSKETGLDEGTVYRALKKLEEKKLVARIDEKDKKTYVLREKLELPPSETNELLQSVAGLPFTKPEALEKEREIYSKNDVYKALQKLWKNIVIKKVTEIYRPVWVAKFVSPQGLERKVGLDAGTGKIISYSKKHMYLNI